jgi:hypothetical protein
VASEWEGGGVKVVVTGVQVVTGPWGASVSERVRARCSCRDVRRLGVAAQT